MSELNNNDFFKQVKAERLFKLAAKIRPGNPGFFIGIWEEDQSQLLEEYILSDDRLTKQFIDKN